MSNFLSRLFTKENKHQYGETLNRFQDEVDAIQSLLNELRTNIEQELTYKQLLEQELTKPKKTVENKLSLFKRSHKETKKISIGDTQAERNRRRVMQNNRYKSTIRKYRLERLVRDTLEKQKRAPLSLNKQMLTTHELAKRWKCNSATLAKWCQTGKAKGYKSAASSESRGYWLVDANWGRTFEEKVLRGEF